MEVEYKPSTMPVVMRSVMYTPGNNPKLIEKARTFNADVIVLDLEDSVPPAEKIKARDMVRDSIPKVAESGADIYVRINDWGTGLTEGDLEAIVQPKLSGIVLPKTESPEDVVKLDEKLTELEEKRGIKPGSIAVQLLIETAKGVVNVYQSAIASDRVNSLVFGAVDYTRDMRIELTKEGNEILPARSQVAIAARAANLVAIDTPWPPFKDVEGFIRDTKFGRQLGYEGRMLIHPNQIEPSHEIYSPPKDDVDYAREVVKVFEEGMKKGLASVPLRGKMLDWAVYRTARDVLAKADLIAEYEKLKSERAKKS
ncbi:MAG: HpcH/HpaI aldolase/citrate lyase family protein [Candidatus Geothermarchaeales archaeon]